MKTLEQLRNTPRLIVGKTGEDGGSGMIYFEKYTASVIWSNGAGWEHVSIAPFKHHITPSWDDMCRVKNMFFNPEEWVIQFHPAASEYINIMPNCLHLWRPLNATMPTPPSILTGIKTGRTLKEG